MRIHSRIRSSALWPLIQFGEYELLDVLATSESVMNCDVLVYFFLLPRSKSGF